VFAPIRIAAGLFQCPGSSARADDADKRPTKARPPMVPLALLATVIQPATREARPAVEAAIALPGTMDGDSLVGPWLILLLCLLAGVGTVLLMPGRFSVAWRRLGAVAALVAGAAMFLAFGVAAETRPVVYFWIFTAIALFGSLRVVTHPRPVYSALYFVLTVFASAGLFVLLWGEFMAVALVVIYAGAILVTYTFVIMLAADAAPPRENGGPASREDAARDFLAEHDRQARNPVSAAAIGFVTAGVLIFVIFDGAPRELVPRLSVTDPAYLVPPASRLRTDALGVDVNKRELSDVAGGTQAPDASPAVNRGPRGDLYPANEQASFSNERGGIQALGIYLFTRQMVSLQLAGLILTVAMVGAIVVARKQVIVPPDVDGRAPFPEGGETFSTPSTPTSDNPHSLPVQGTRDPRQKAYPQT
jgi:NADH-quinone oxidoreductase subunit J